MAALAVLSLAPAAHAQGVRYDNILLNAQGTPISGASVAVCTIAADTNTKPCAPLVQIYSDRALTVPLANPFLTALGNYGFYAAPGTYLVQIYGGQLTTKVYTVTLPCDPAASSSCGTASGLSTTSAVSTGTLSVTGNISATGTVTASNIPANIAGKPATSDAVRFVSTSGANTNDGLSWGTAYKTIYAAWTAAVDATTNGGHNFGGGTIYLGAGAACGGPTTGQGLWIAGPSYAQWLAFATNSNNTVKISAIARSANVVTVTLTAAPPSAYTLGASIAVYGASDSSFNGTFTIASVGASNFTYSQTGANASATDGVILPSAWLPQLDVHAIGAGSVNTFQMPTPTNQLSCGSSTQNALDIQGTNQTMEFDNLSFTGKIGLNLANATSLTFNDDAFQTDRTFSTNGPATLVGAGSFWLFFNRCLFASGGTAAVGDGSNHTEAFVYDPGSGQGGGLIFIDHGFINGGGDLKVNSFGANGTFSITTDGLQTEGQTDGHGAVWVVPAATAFTTFRLNDITVSDATVNPTPAVEIPVGSYGGAALVEDAFGFNVNVSGPATVLSQYGNNLQNVTALPSKSHQLGFSEPTDDARRQFGLVASRFTNVAAQLPSAWNKTTACFSTTCTLASVAAPDGTTNAGQMTATGSGQDGVYFYIQNTASSAGDYWIMGAWFRSTAGNGFSGGTALSDTFSGCTVTDISGASSSGTFGGGIDDGQWHWAAQAVKITVGGTCDTRFGGAYDSTHTTDFYGPVFIHIAAGTVSDNEAAEIGAHLGSYPDSLAPPVEATLRGHPIAFGGSGDNFFATLDHTALTANRTYTLPDAAGAIALSGANGISAGTVTLSAGAGSHTFGTAYSTAPTCTATDTTAANAVKATSSTTAVTLAGTGTDVVAWICAPAVN